MLSDLEEDHYRKFTAPIIEYLNELGVNATFSGRNDITIDGKKISGNAQTVFKDRIMHHGTILFDTDSSELSSCLNPSKIKMESKGIKSVRARVVNVVEYLPNVTTAEFKKGLENKFKSTCIPYQFSSDDLSAINKLVEEKYSKYSWNIGRSPTGKNTFEYKFPFGIFTLNFDTEQGKLANVKILGDFFEKKDISTFSAKLEGIRFEKQAFISAFNEIGEYISGANASDIVDKIFE